MAGGKWGLTEAQKTERDAKKALMRAVGSIMHRLPTTKWTDEETSALKKIYPRMNADRITRVGAFYAAHWPPDRENHLRHDVLRLVRPWPDELDKANAWLSRLPPAKRERLLAGAQTEPPLPPAPRPPAPEIPAARPPEKTSTRGRRASRHPSQRFNRRICRCKGATSFGCGTADAKSIPQYRNGQPAARSDRHAAVAAV